MRTCLACIVSLAGASAAMADTTVTFDNGLEGWSVSGRTDINATGGNPGANLNGELFDVFGADIRTDSNAAFIGDLTRYGSFELSVDVRVNSINMLGNEVPRDFVVEIRDNTNNNGYPYTSVYYHLGTLSGTDANAGEWVTYSVIIDDPFAIGLPAGWGGTGAEDPNTFEPILEPGRTFTSVLQSADSLHFTTFVPGYFFGFTNFNIQVDNISIRTIPAPSALAMLGLAGLAGTRRRRGA
jgi:hypothetical protein